MGRGTSFCLTKMNIDLKDFWLKDDLDMSLRPSLGGWKQERKIGVGLAKKSS